MRAPARLELQSWSTDDLPAGERHEAWVNRDWPSLAPIYHTEPLEPFSVSSERLRLGDIVVHYTSITAQRWRRGGATLRAVGPDALTVAITLEGEAQGVMGERDFLSGPGSVQLCDLSQASSHVSTASRTILIIVPRAVATGRGLDVAALHGLVLQAGAAELLAPHLLGVRKAAPTLQAGDGALLGQTVLDLLVLAVASAGRMSAPPIVRREAVATVARASIERRLGSPALTIPNLCRELQISRTTLHRLFETDGGVQAYIRGRRLEAARLALADPAGAEPIYALAERFGFSDAAHLSRLFRARYGLTPSDHRARARRG